MAIDTSFLDELKKFSLIVHKRVTSNYSGPRRSIASGKGISFREHRIYAPGDDIKLIDWNVYARTDDLYVKNFEEERNLTVHIIVDYSESMNFGKQFTKFDYSCMLGVGFAYLAMNENEKFQFSTFSENIDVFQPKKGMSQLASMVYYLNNLKPKGLSRLLDSIIHYKRFITGRSMIILISDFLIDIEEIKEALYRLGKHEVKIIHVLDPVEKNLTLAGDHILKDSETKDELRTNISPSLRTKYQEMIEGHANEIEKTCIALGYDYHLITTDKALFDVFYEMLE